MKIENVENSIGSGGRTQMLRFMKGERLTRNQAIKAKCYDCTCGYQDGRVDCEIYDCPLHPYMPYKKKLDKAKIPTIIEED